MEQHVPLIQFSASVHVPHWRNPNFTSQRKADRGKLCIFDLACTGNSSATLILNRSPFSLFLRGLEKHCSSCVFDICLPKSASECLATSSVSRSNNALSVFSISLVGVNSSEECIASALDCAEIPNGAFNISLIFVNSNVIGLMVPCLLMYNLSL